MTGLMVNSSGLTGYEFMPDRDFVSCAICGAVFQHALSRLPVEEITEMTTLAAELRRREWSRHHAASHTSTEHRQLAASGRKMTPEAAHKLATLGVVSLTDIVMSDEHRHAAATAPRAPINDVEGVKY